MKALPDPQDLPDDADGGEPDIDADPTDPELIEDGNYPIWRRAAYEANAQFDYDDVIPKSWILQHLDIEQPDGPIMAEKHVRISFLLLSRMDKFRDQLLIEYRKYIVNRRNVGYLVVKPNVQTAFAMQALKSSIQRDMNKTILALAHINDSYLSLEELRENDDAKGRLAWLRLVGLKKLKEERQS